ncbi:flagellar hook-basal body complex protein FliE [Ferrovibrio sp.]|uniref:flagellar hook-basal body complex protein FliE n=1 Tax=Ferrovibrio sp. TaxID=1917215 RepID=UPI0025C30F73|nr:flagellar hook-basal body complex protein FliE [Ferrovibrio sp.]MBX3455526.1 flagellar hook-basal body complex protein FliE [Ferrovibrio sp.]
MVDLRIGGFIGGLSGAPKSVGNAVPEGGGFGDLVRDALQSTIKANHQAEQVSAQAVAGKADVTDVVTAVTNAEVALDTVVAVRDKVITAYQEIMRMPI